MADYTTYSRESSSQSDVASGADSTSQAQASLFINSISSNNSQPSGTTSISEEGNPSPGENMAEVNCSAAPDPTPMGSQNRDHAGDSHVPVEKTLGEEHDKIEISASTRTAILRAKDDKTEPPFPRTDRPTTTLKTLSRMSTPLVLSVLAICLLATVITYVQSTYAAEERSSQGRPLSNLLRTDVSRTLTILRASQGILSALLSMAVDNIFVLLQWSQIHQPDGISYLNILALSPTTGALGTLGLIKSSGPRISAKLWALSRSVSSRGLAHSSVSNLSGQGDDDCTHLVFGAGIVL